MTVKNIEDTLIREVATILSKDPSAVTADIPLHELGLDSLGFVELLVTIERVFSMNLMESGLSKSDFQMIRSLASYISKLNGK
ncbi:acyl carrier protein [Desulfococcaceae bacterium HSG8]|nr:acyl carrier protein [Desulfococcaceae bacterium HSG8]